VFFNGIRHEPTFNVMRWMAGKGRERNGSLRTIRSGSGRSIVLVGGHNSTLLGHSALALGMALLPRLEGLFQASARCNGSTLTATVKEI
jgi:hypothetical protein